MSGQVPGTKCLGQLGRLECLVSQAADMSVVVLLWGSRGQSRRRWEGHRPEAAVQISAVGRRGAVGTELRAMAVWR